MNDPKLQVVFYPFQTGPLERGFLKADLKCLLIKCQPLIPAHPHQPFIRGKFLYMMQYSFPIPRTDLLTGITPEKAISHLFLYF